MLSVARVRSAEDVSTIYSWSGSCGGVDAPTGPAGEAAPGFAACVVLVSGTLPVKLERGIVEV